MEVFCLHGVWKIIFIDDCFPVSNNKLVFSKAINNAIQVIILEKAWEKLADLSQIQEEVI